ncbi:MAG: NifU family protein [bacterium]
MQEYELEKDINDLIETQIKPLLKIHGGGIRLIKITDDKTIKLAFEGACLGCPLKSVTYALGVRQRLLQHPEIHEVEIEGVRLSKAALNRVEKTFSGYSFWEN